MARKKGGGKTGGEVAGGRRKNGAFLFFFLGGKQAVEGGKKIWGKEVVCVPISSPLPLLLLRLPWKRQLYSRQRERERERERAHDNLKGEFNLHKPDLWAAESSSKQLFFPLLSPLSLTTLLLPFPFPSWHERSVCPAGWEGRRGNGRSKVE